MRMPPDLAKPKPRNNTPLHILVVDDSPDDAALAVEELRRSGFHVVHQRVDTGAALDAAIDARKWDLALVDECMPSFAGVEARKLLRQRHPELPFIIVSGFLTEDTAAHAIRAGACDLVLKDNLSRLAPAVERVLKETQLRRQQQKTEQALQLSQSRYDQLFRLCPDAILVLEKQRVRTLNTAALKLLGANSPQEVVGRSIAGLFESMAQPVLRRQVRALLQSGKPVPLIEQKLVNLQGQTLDVEIALATVDGPMSAGIQMVVRDVSDRRRLEREVLEASHRERQRMGEDLHDGLCQLLLGIKFRNTILHQKLQGRLGAATADARRIAGLLDRAIAEAQTLARGLTPVRTGPEGLMTALRTLAETTTAAFGVRCHCTIHDPVMVRQHHAAVHLYRIAQEAVSNAVKHAKPTKIDIAIRQDRARVTLTVANDGQGFNPDLVTPKGMGLRIMAYRARVIRGALTISLRRRGGTEVRCVVPARSIIR